MNLTILGRTLLSLRRHSKTRVREREKRVRSKIRFVPGEGIDPEQTPGGRVCLLVCNSGFAHARFPVGTRFSIGRTGAPKSIFTEFGSPGAAIEFRSQLRLRQTRPWGTEASSGDQKHQRVVNTILHDGRVGDGDMRHASDQFIDIGSWNRVSPDPPENARLIVIDVILSADR